jgi:hypothetical protein
MPKTSFSKNSDSLDIIAEFDDSALRKAFGKEGVGIFLASQAIEHKVMQQYNVK